MAASDGWTYEPALTPPGPDYAVGFDLRIDQAAVPVDPLIEVARFSYYDSKGDLAGYEAAVALRRTAQGRMYLVLLSSARQEVVLWSSCGGILQVRPLPLSTGQVHHVRASVSGQHLTASVDDRQAIDYWDTVAPIPAGEAALGHKEGSAAFSGVTLEKL